MDDIKFIEHMQVLRIQDGDVLIFKYDSLFDQETFDRISRQIGEAIVQLFGKPIPALILERGQDIGVLRKTDGGADD